MSNFKYKDWEITYNPKPIPVRVYDYEAVHKDYDGLEENRCFTGESVQALKDRIDELEAEEE
jgi:hypothetical protein